MTKFFVVQVHNPLDPRDSSREEVTSDKSLAELFPPVAVQVPMAYTINGRVIDAEEMATTYPQDGEYVTVCPIPQGGGGKNILRLVALIAVAVFAQWAAPYVGAAVGVTGTVGVGAIAAGITVAGSMLVNSLLPPPVPTGGRSSEESPSYGIDGAKNTSAEGIVVPVCYGQFRMAGNVLNNYVVNDGQTQYLYMLINAGEGQIAGIGDIEVNDQPITSYKDYEVDVRLGTSVQQPMSWFSDTITPFAISQKIVDTYKTYTTSGEVDRLRVDVVAPGGLFYAKDDGSLGKATVTLNFEYRLVGAPSWTPFQATGDVVSYTESFEYEPVRVVDEFGQETGATVPYVPTGGEYAIGGLVYASYASHTGPKVVGRVKRTPNYGPAGTASVSSSVRNAYRRSFLSPLLPEGVYELRYKRTTVESTNPRLQDSVYVSDINEMTNEDVAHRYSALLGIKIRLSDQLNGLPKVTFRHGGKLIRAWNKTTAAFDSIASANPAWVAMDIISNKRYGGGAPMSRFIMSKFKDWAQFCDDNGLEFHGVFDTKGNIWDASNEVARCGRAQLIQIGTRFGVVIERSEDPVMAFNVTNMIEGTFKETWLPMNDRANEVEITYSEKDDGYMSHTVRLYDKDALAAGAPQRTAAVTMKGIVTAQRAYQEAQLMLNLNRYIQRTIEFGAPIEAIACSPGDVILVQHDMPKWGDGGRLESGSTGTVLALDRPVTLQYGKTYQALVHADSISVLSNTVHSVDTTRKWIYLNGMDESTAKVERLIIAGIDRRIIARVQHPTVSTRWGVEVESLGSVAAGNAFVLYDTNVILTRSVANTAPVGGFVELSSLTLTATLGFSPPTYAKWFFGETNKVAKPFRVRTITGSHDYRRDIVAIEYNDSVYNPGGAVPTLNYSTLASKLVLPVTIDSVQEAVVKVGASYQSRVTIGYSSSQATYLDAEVFVSRNEGPFVSVGRNKSTVTVNAVKDEILDFRVVARDRGNNSAPVTTSPTFHYITTGVASLAPADVTGLIYTVEPNVGVRLAWDQAADLAEYYEVREGTNWLTAAFVTRIKATSYPVGPITTAARTYLVKAIDYAGNYSDTAASTTISVTGPAPPAVDYSIDGVNELLTWTIPGSPHTVDRYEIRQGSSWATATFVDTTKGTSLRRRVNYAGDRTYLVAAIDIAGNVGAAASVDSTITVPGTVNALRTEVVDNNVLLFWTPPITGSMPVERYEVRKGATFAGGAVVGSNGNSTFAAVFEQQAADYTYWVAPVDSAGNFGTAVSITAKVAQPPDYILRATVDSTFTGTKTNFYQEGNTLVGPVDTSETWATHFSSRGYTTPQDQITAGYPIYAQPSVTSGSYSEIFDYGAVLGGTTITSLLTYVTLAGTVTAACQISYKLNLGDPWTNAPAGLDSVLASNFRYVQVTWTFSCTAGANLIRIDGLQLKLANKLKTDSGAGTITNATTGVVMNFSIPFVSADTPVIQPNGAVPLTPVVDYAGGPNPTTFTVYLYNNAGVKVTGSFSWTARGL